MKQFNTKWEEKTVTIISDSLYYEGKASLNRCVLRCELKVDSVVKDRMSCGSVFQSQGAEHLKDLNPIVDKCAEGVKRSEVEEVLSVREGMYV